ncbi:MAG: T9SS type A sorting domain-containing protein [Spirochaetes bacterium]|nr:T9SS type A sorting domain-containing protein [Spirochaetota bacterium]
MKTHSKIPLISMMLVMLVLPFCMDAANAVPTYSHVSYGSASRQWLHIYIATNSSTPKPVYIWAHADGTDANSFDDYLWKICRTNGISAISWEAVEMVDSPSTVATSEADFDVMLDWVRAHAAEYNINPDKIVIGGTSRGTVVSWKKCHTRWQDIRGIYMVSAMPDPVWAFVSLGMGDDPRTWVHANSRKCFLTYYTVPNTDDIHDPMNGVKLTNKYAALGIGDRTTLYHSVTNTSTYRWLPAFIKEVTADPPPPPTAACTPADMTTNKTFTASLDVDTNDGYWSTNNVTYYKFTTAGTNISISRTTTVWYFGSNADGVSAKSSNRYVFDTTAPNVSGAPAGLTTNSSFTVTLDVNENHGYWSTNGSAYSSFTTSGTSITVSRTTTLSYYGRDILGNTSGTNSITYTVALPKPAAPQNVTASLVQGAGAAVRWHDASGIEDGFIVYRSTSSNSGFTAIAMPAANGTNCIDSNTAAGNTYYYKVSATNGSGESSRTGPVSLTVPSVTKTPDTLANATALNNPYRGTGDGVRFINLPENTVIHVYSVSGRLIATIRSSVYNGEAVWDTKTSAGKDVPSGVYFCRLSNGTEMKTIRVLVVR